MSRIVQTTVKLEFQSMDSGTPQDGFHYVSWLTRPGFLCRLADEGKDDAMLIPLRHPTWFVNAKSNEYEDANAMVVIAEIHAGKLPENVLEGLE